MSFTVYILCSLRVPRTYVGYTADLEERLRYHNGGRVRATRPYMPWKVIYTEDGLIKEEAKNQELYWKSGAGRRNLSRIIGGFPPRLKSGRGSPKFHLGGKSHPAHTSTTLSVNTST
ncbi:MAG: GIY-YIG nuclease family protein [Candidatus Jorgensenbacteria bacterium]